MSDGPTLHTARLVLRPWTDADRAPFAALNADPRVMEHFPALLSAEECAAMIDKGRAHFGLHGYGFWALELAGRPGLIGFTGLGHPAFTAPFTPCVEVGWRLAFEHWGRGYATEAARESLRFAFEELALREVVSFTVPANVRSRRVMEKLGLRHAPEEDFEHPRVPEGHRLRRHVLYRLGAEDWRRGRPASSRG